MARLLTPAEVAERLTVELDHVRLLIKRRLLIAVNVGTGPKRPTYRVEEEELEAFIESKRAAPTVLKERRRSRSREREPVHDYFPEECNQS